RGDQEDERVGPVSERPRDLDEPFSYQGAASDPRSDEGCALERREGFPGERICVNDPILAGVRADFPMHDLHDTRTRLEMRHAERGSTLEIRSCEHAIHEQGDHDMIPRQLISVVAALSLLSVAATGCGTVTGAAVGGGAGAAVGAGTGYGEGKGALIGLGVGAAAGAVYDVVKHDKKDSPRGGADETLVVDFQCARDGRVADGGTGVRRVQGRML